MGSQREKFVASVMHQDGSQVTLWPRAERTRADKAEVKTGDEKTNQA